MPVKKPPTARATAPRLNDSAKKTPPKSRAIPCSANPVAAGVACKTQSQIPRSARRLASQQNAADTAATTDSPPAEKPCPTPDDLLPRSIMNDRIKRYYDGFTHTVTYGTINADDYGPKSALPGYYNELGEVIKDMDKAKAGQLGGSGADVTDGLISALQTDLQLIGGIARPLNAEHPGLKDKFPTVGTTDQSILTTADAYLKELEIKPADSPAVQAAKTALADLFIAHEMPETFVADLREDRDLIPPAGQAQASKTDNKVENTAALTLLARKGMLIHGKIVAALAAKFTRQPDKLRAAQSATHIERAPQRAKKPGATSGKPAA